MNRRKFVGIIGLGAATVCAEMNFVTRVAGFKQEQAAGKRRKIKKSVKWGMVQAGDSVLEKFEIQKELGYDGVEFVSPTDIDLDEVIAASQRTHMPVHGLVNMKHWDIRMSSPDATQRAQAVKIMKNCISDCKKLGGKSVLLVPGKVNGDDETHDDVWIRSIECIRQVIPAAEKHGVKILIENVWNGFCEQPEMLKKYIDEISSDWVKVYFDIGNARIFAPSEKWVQVLGNRIEKLDVKGWGQKNSFCKIGDGEVNWPAVCEELDKLEFEGWSTAEVGGGGKERLQEIADRVDRVLVKPKQSVAVPK